MGTYTSSPIEHSFVNYFGGMSPIVRLWKELFPTTQHVYDCSRCRDPDPDTDHLGLADSVSERLCDQFWGEIVAVIEDVAKRVAAVDDGGEVVVGMVCRWFSIYVYKFSSNF